MERCCEFHHLVAVDLFTRECIKLLLVNMQHCMRDGKGGGHHALNRSICIFMCAT